MVAGYKVDINVTCDYAMYSLYAISCMLILCYFCLTTWTQKHSSVHCNHCSGLKRSTAVLLMLSGCDGIAALLEGSYHTADFDEPFLVEP